LLDLGVLRDKSVFSRTYRTSKGKLDQGLKLRGAYIQVVYRTWSGVVARCC
jgi:hypothetical protein